MLTTKTILVASALGCASAADNAAVPTAAMTAMKAMLSQRAKDVASSTSSTSYSYSSSSVTTGSIVEAQVGSCASPKDEQEAFGINLGACWKYGATSFKYVSCEFNTDSTIQTRVFDYYGSNDCTGDPSSFVDTVTGLVNGCGLNDDGEEVQYYCLADEGHGQFDSPQYFSYYTTDSCEGSEVAWTVVSYSSCEDSSGCILLDNDWSAVRVCDNGDDYTCFHVDTKIDYKGVEYTYDELKAGKEPECTVPHSPSSKGVVISTSCGKTVRVTDTHLMATTKGFQLAYSLKVGDVLFGDYDKDLCTVQSVQKEKTTQQYFGLNCVHSEVLASGLRASTFGDFHTLPSWYMTYVGGLVGADTASFLGEFIAEWYFQK